MLNSKNTKLTDLHDFKKRNNNAGIRTRASPSEWLFLMLNPANDSRNIPMLKLMLMGILHTLAESNMNL